MSYQSDHLSAAIRKARRVLGLSQRALSAKSGVPQAQISKFENGTVDLRLSSLVALFRALDLELELVPKKSIPAVQMIVRNTMLRSATDPRQFAEAKTAFHHILHEIGKFDQWSEEIKRLQECMNFLERIHIPATQSKNFIRWAKYLQRLRKTPVDSEKIEKLTKRTEQLRNQLERAQTLSNQSQHPKPIYSLEEEDSDA